jgi:hypothetical protein
MGWWWDSTNRPESRDRKGDRPGDRPIVGGHRRVSVEQYDEDKNE